MRVRWSRHPACVLALVPILWSQNQLQLVGVGSTFPLKAYTIWMAKYGIARSDIHVTYMPFGSARGTEMVAAGEADFGDSDVPGASSQTAGKLLFFPVALGAIVPIYNLAGLDQPLQFTPQALAGIYLGKISRWDDPLLAAANPGVDLPASKIIVIHSAAGRGSTYIWSDYLSKVSQEWRSKVGRGIEPNWPVGKEEDGNGNVAKAVQGTPDSIAYVELAFAVRAGLQQGRVQNSAGSFVTADERSTAAAAAPAAKKMGADCRCSITNPIGADSYPIASFTWLVLPNGTGAAQKQRAVKDFLRWILTEGQRDVSPAGLSRVPEELVAKELSAIEKIP